MTITNTPSDAGSLHEAYWWQGSLMKIKARAEDTDGALGVVDAEFYEGFGPPLHVHHREDETMYVLEGEIHFRVGDEEFIAGPGTLVHGKRGVPHAFKVRPGGARALVIVTPGGFERMFEVGGVPVAESAEPPVEEYDPQAAVALAKEFGFEVIGPQLT